MIELKSVQANHQLFLEQLYRSTREDELKQTNWTELQKKQFVLMQFLAQKADYEKKYPNAVQQIISLKKQPAGRLWLNENAENIHIIDIALLPKYQGKGIGSKILKEVLQNAKQQHKKVTLSVIKTNPAKKLYQRLGFVTVNDAGFRDDMEYV